MEIEFTEEEKDFLIGLGLNTLIAAGKRSVESEESAESVKVANDKLEIKPKKRKLTLKMKKQISRRMKKFWRMKRNGSDKA